MSRLRPAIVFAPIRPKASWQSRNTDGRVKKQSHVFGSRLRAGEMTAEQRTVV